MKNYLSPLFETQEIEISDIILVSGVTSNNVGDFDPSGEVKDVIDW